MSRKTGCLVVCTLRSLHTQGDMMEASRWLLPFTHGVDMQAIDNVVSLAKSTGATLVAVSLISASSKAGSRGPRLEYIQQSKDFLEAIKWKAARYEVPVERHEVFTADVMQSIAILTHEMRCNTIVLVSSSEREALLQAHEVKYLLIEPPASLVIIRLSANHGQTPTRHVLTRFFALLRRIWWQQDASQPEPDALALEEPLGVNVEEYRS
jgi:hypothetical protein